MKLGRLEVAYVGGVAALTAIATSDPNHFRESAFVTALVLCLPALVAALPVLYVAASTAFNVTGADDGGTSWPVTATYVLVLTATAALNVYLLRTLARRRRSKVDVPTT
jgi:hypothetical protein